jgi:hypothetical protein
MGTNNSGRGYLQSVPGYNGPAELAVDDVQRVSRALLLLTTAAEKITFETASVAPPTQSVAHRLFGAEEKHAIDGFITMQFANMSAYGHVRGFVALVRTSTVRSTALATVARGTLESLARTWYLVERAEGNFFYRTISLLHSDLRYPALLDETINTRDGDPVDPVAKRAFYAGELTRLGLPAPAKTDLSLMVAAMLDAEMQQNDGRKRYSALSSVAHAHRLGINTFITTTEHGEITGLAAPRPVVIDMAGQLVAALYGTSRVFVEFYGDQARHIELLEAAMERSLQALSPITESIWSDSEG